MKCKTCPFFIRKDYQWGWCRKDGIDKESEQHCTVYLLGIYKTVKEVKNGEVNKDNQG